MTEFYLIAHKVRGEPAFDVATRIKCPVCEPIRQGLDVSSHGCEACDYEGHWWIVSTSGHRAYPYWDCKLIPLLEDGGRWPDDMPEGIRDHYAQAPAPSGGKITALNLADLGL